MRSYESQFITIIKDPAKGLDNKQQIDAITLDFSKASDKVPHHRLAMKLHQYGVRGNMLKWIENFLANCSQQVVLDGKPTPVTSRAPQGTVPGSLLFLVYINDLPQEVSSISRFFAVDCLL